MARLKPGQTAPKSGQYQQIGPQGGSDQEQVGARLEKR